VRAYCLVEYVLAEFPFMSMLMLVSAAIFLRVQRLARFCVLDTILILLVLYFWKISIGMKEVFAA